MDTRIRFCVALDALAVLLLIGSAVSLIGADWLPGSPVEMFGSLFAATLATFATARIIEIGRAIWRTPTAGSMRAMRAQVPVPATGIEAAAKATDSDLPRAA
ncbi:MAG: hypothetical protein H6978_16410 [Gammaproteobacteria bacterium]|nr:hypothetical protein [Gammaproteobacteria bacterium]MCP5146395.1 hypothetical protein [Gammaproteobacteria bacterium]